MYLRIDIRTYISIRVCTYERDLAIFGSDSPIGLFWGVKRDLLRHTATHQKRPTPTHYIQHNVHVSRVWCFRQSLLMYQKRIAATHTATFKNRPTATLCNTTCMQFESDRSVGLFSCIQDFWNVHGSFIYICINKKNYIYVHYPCVLKNI